MNELTFKSQKVLFSTNYLMRFSYKVSWTTWILYVQGQKW